MKLGVVTTSWPTERVPWAGHFIADFCRALGSVGWDIDVATLRWTEDGAPSPLENGAVHASVMRGARPHLPSAYFQWPRLVRRLRKSVSQVEAHRWVAHWWPTLVAIPGKVPAMTVLHGSDMDLLERLPRAIARWVSRRSHVVAVAPRLAMRFEHLTGIRPPVCLLGARSGDETGPVPETASDWVASPQPRILTIARNCPGKGREVALAARDLIPHCAWFIGGGQPALTPSEVRTLIRKADVVVVPSQQGKGLPSEGRPHIISQALVAGVPVVGGPNHAVVDALEDAGQIAVYDGTAQSLAVAVENALRDAPRKRMVSDALRHGKRFDWSAVVTDWEREIEAAWGA